MCYKNKMSDFLTKIKNKIYCINLTFLYHNSFEKKNIMLSHLKISKRNWLNN